MINSKITDQILRTVKIQELFGQKNFTQIELEYSPATKTLWNFMKPRGIHCFNIDLLKEIRLNDEELETNGGLFLHNGELQHLAFSITVAILLYFPN